MKEPRYIRGLKAAVGAGNVVTDHTRLTAYSYDGQREQASTASASPSVPTSGSRWTRRPSILRSASSGRSTRRGF